MHDRIQVTMASTSHQLTWPAWPAWQALEDERRQHAEQIKDWEFGAPSGRGKRREWLLPYKHLYI